MGSTTVGSQPDTMKAAAAMDLFRRNTIMAEGNKRGIHEAILALACEQNHSWEATQSAHETATVVFEMYKATGARYDLSYNPLAHQMAELMAKLHTPEQEPATKPQPDVATLQSDIAAAAGLH